MTEKLEAYKTARDQIPEGTIFHMTHPWFKHNRVRVRDIVVHTEPLELFVTYTLLPEVGGQAVFVESYDEFMRKHERSTYADPESHPDSSRP
jgi:hypothetical protein